MSPTGRDGFLGHTPDLPVKTFGAATKILATIKERSVKKPRFLKLKEGEYFRNPNSNEMLRLTREDNNITDDVLTIQPYNNADVTLTGSYITLTGISVTDNGLCRVMLPRKPGRRYIVNTDIELRIIGEGYNYLGLGEYYTTEQYEEFLRYNNTTGQFDGLFEHVPAGGVSQFLLLL
jgi:hypothetical protein